MCRKVVGGSGKISEIGNDVKKMQSDFPRLNLEFCLVDYVVMKSFKVLRLWDCK
jgi:hypothetical protein